MSNALMIENELKNVFKSASFDARVDEDFLIENLCYGVPMFIKRMTFPNGFWVDVFFHYDNDSKMYGSCFKSSTGLNSYANSDKQLFRAISSLCGQVCLNQFKL